MHADQLSHYYLPSYLKNKDSIQVQVMSQGHKVQAIQIDLEPSTQKKPVVPSVVTAGFERRGKGGNLLLKAADSGYDHICLRARDEYIGWREYFSAFPLANLFYPPQVTAWLSQTTRYDPHNSYIALIYRTGLLGFFFFLAILYFVVRHLIRFTRNQDFSLPFRLWSTLLFAAIVYHQIHSQTDVTMENAFKGVPLWIFFGLALRSWPREATENPSFKA